MPSQKLREFLDKHQVRYVTTSHSPAYPAQEVAAAAHVPGRELAKSVIVRLDGELAMVVLPAPERIDFEQLREVTGAAAAELVNEKDFARHFPGCEVGAMPPFGNLFDMPVYVADTFTDVDEISFNAGTHTELVRLAFADFKRLVQPTMAGLTRMPIAG